MSYTYDQLYAYNGELLNQLDALRAAFDTAMQQAAAKRHELREIELDLSKQLEELRAKYEQLENRYLRDIAAEGRVVDMLSDIVRELRAEYNVLFEQREKLRSDYDELSAEYHAMRDAHVKRNLDLLAENAYLRDRLQGAA